MGVSCQSSLGRRLVFFFVCGSCDGGICARECALPCFFVLVDYLGRCERRAPSALLVRERSMPNDDE